MAVLAAFIAPGVGVGQDDRYGLGHIAADAGGNAPSRLLNPAPRSPSQATEGRGVGLLLPACALIRRVGRYLNSIGAVCGLSCAL